MVTVGYGDITPETSEEILISIVIMLFGSGVYVYAINTVGVIL